MEEVKESNIIEPYGFIYITTNLVNGKRYIGQRKFYGTSKITWQDYLGSGTVLKRAINKYGEENFQKIILNIAYNENDLNQLETQYIKDYNAVVSKDFYNLASGGHGGNTLAGKTEEEMIQFKRKVSKANAGINSAWYGKHHTQEEIEKIRNWNKGKIVSDETKLKMSNTQKTTESNFKGKHHSEEAKRKMSESRKGRHLSDENKRKLIESHLGKVTPDDVRQKISLSNRGKIKSIETREKISKANKGKLAGKKHPFAKSVFCIDTDEKFDTILDASIKYNVDNSSIGKCCKSQNKCKYAGKLVDGTKLHWMYFEEYIKNRTDKIDNKGDK